MESSPALNSLASFIFVLLRGVINSGSGAGQESMSHRAYPGQVLGAIFTFFLFKVLIKDPTKCNIHELNPP